MQGDRCARLHRSFETRRPYLHPAAFIETDDANTMRPHGWRSVSVLMVPYATVLFAAETAPSFLRHHQGAVLQAADDIVSRLFVSPRS